MGDAPGREAVAALHGVPAADARVGATGDLDADLVYAALSTPAPTLAAFILKLEVLAAPGEWNAFDNDTWPIFLADMRRFACLKAISKKGGRQS